MRLHHVVTIACVAFGSLCALPSVADPLDWNGSWSGQSSDGQPTQVVISKGKVTKWLNNGYGRTVKTSTVTPGKVTIEDTNGWVAIMTPQGGGAFLKASGIGNNGSPARNSSVLTKG